LGEVVHNVEGAEATITGQPDHAISLCSHRLELGPRIYLRQVLRGLALLGRPGLPRVGSFIAALSSASSAYIRLSLAASVPNGPRLPLVVRGHTDADLPTGVLHRLCRTPNRYHAHAAAHHRNRARGSFLSALRSAQPCVAHSRTGAAVSNRSLRSQLRFFDSLPPRSCEALVQRLGQALRTKVKVEVNDDPIARVRVIVTVRALEFGRTVLRAA